MRAGAGEFLDHSAGFEGLLEALTRFSSSRTRTLGGAGKARVFTFRAQGDSRMCGGARTFLSEVQMKSDVSAAVCTTG